ncbi:MAG: hypothetical protein JXA94_05385, partial [Parachlamydiales bacterium]|nr:hypothetical protein [Parachlamydiales bacterium]
KTYFLSNSNGSKINSMQNLQLWFSDLMDTLAKTINSLVKSIFNKSQYHRSRHVSETGCIE